MKKDKAWRLSHLVLWPNKWLRVQTDSTESTLAVMLFPPWTEFYPKPRVHQLQERAVGIMSWSLDKQNMVFTFMHCSRESCVFRVCICFPLTRDFRTSLAMKSGRIDRLALWPAEDAKNIVQVWKQRTATLLQHSHIVGLFSPLEIWKTALTAVAAKKTRHLHSVQNVMMSSAYWMTPPDRASLNSQPRLFKVVSCTFVCVREAADTNAAF